MITPVIFWSETVELITPFATKARPYGRRVRANAANDMLNSPLNHHGECGESEPRASDQSVSTIRRDRTIPTQIPRGFMAKDADERLECPPHGSVRTSGHRDGRRLSCGAYVDASIL